MSGPFTPAWFGGGSGRVWDPPRQLLVSAPVGWHPERLQRAVDALGPVQFVARTVPTAAMLVPLVVAGLLYLLGRAAGSSFLVLGAAVVLALPVVSLLLRPRLDGLEVVRGLGPRVRVGGTTAMWLEIVNHGRRRSPACLAVDELPGHAPLRVAAPSLAPGERVEVSSERLALARTRTLTGLVRLSATCPLGLLVARRDLPFGGEVRVWPAALPAPLLRPAAAETAAARTRPRTGSGTEVLGLRAWRPGDAARDVSARASARHGRPVVLERERDAGGALVLLITGGDAGPEREAALAQAAALGVAAVRAGRPVEVLGPGCAPHPADWQLLDAVADADEAPPLDQAAVTRALRAAGRTGQIVLVGSAPDGTGPSDAARRLAAARCPVVVLGA